MNRSWKHQISSLYIFSKHQIQLIFTYFYNNISWLNNTACYSKYANKLSKHCCWYKDKLESWKMLLMGAVLTRSVQVAVVLSFSSISFPIFCTVTWVCLMALWAVWSLQEEENTKSPSRSLFITAHWTTKTTPCWNCVSNRPLNWLAASVLWLRQQFISFSLDVYCDCLVSIMNFDCPHVEESLCSVFVMPPCFFFWFTGVEPYCSSLTADSPKL